MLISRLREFLRTAMENEMSELSLRSVHPAEKKEITPWGVWLITRFIIGLVFVVMSAPFLIHYLGL